MKKIDFYEIRGRIAGRMADRRRLGWFDFSPFSYDMRVAHARAWRIVCRLNGRRITLREAFNE
jgi:hypothetical protein